MSARVNHIPGRALLVIATSARIVVAETVKDFVPERIEHRDQGGFTERNPNIIYDQVPTSEIIKKEVFSLLDRFCVLTQATV